MTEKTVVTIAIARKGPARIVGPKQSSNNANNESSLNAAFAKYLNGETEVRLNYTTRDNVDGYVLVDIVTIIM